MSWSLKNSGVVMNANLRAMAEAIASRVDFDIVVTSGVRTPRAQASAMKNKIARGENLRVIYANDQYADDVTAAYPDLDAMTIVTKRYANAGLGSKHTAGQGLDLRTWDASHVQPMIDAAKDAGYSPFLEADHLHVDGTGSTDTKKSYLILAILAAGALWMSRK